MSSRPPADAGAGDRAVAEAPDEALRRENAALRAELADLRDAHDLVLDYLEVVLAERDRYRRAVDGVRELVPARVQRLLVRVLGAASSER